jgi:uncharacterized membrane protein
MSQDKQTVNVLVLELATMVVAISLAFTSTFVAKLDIDSIISYIFTNVMVIWFWWEYVVDRLAYPPKTFRFPMLDIFILILISLVPFALKLGGTDYISGVVGVLVIVWALLIRVIIGEYHDDIAPSTRSSLEAEVRQRLVIGPAFLVVAAFSTLSDRIGRVFFGVLVVFIILWTASSRRSSDGATVGDPSRRQP